MPEPRSRKDAARNRAAVLAAADTLFTDRASTEDVTMAEVAAAAGVGKGTLFRAFGDRTGLIRALFQARQEPVRQAVEEGPPPLGPAAEPLQRIPALLDALLCFKLDNRHLALALEDSASPYQAEHYERWHALLQGLLDQVPDLEDSGFTAHALLAAVRADLVEYLAGHERLPRDQMRARLAGLTARILGTDRSPDPAAGSSGAAADRSR